MKVGILKTLYYLFFFPAVFLDLKKMPWWRGFCSLMMTTFLLSLLFFSFFAPSFSESVDNLTNWFSSQITEISVNDQDKVVLSTEKEIPFESSFGSFLLLVENEETAVDVSRMNTPSGLWLSPTDIVHWSFQGEQKILTPIVEKSEFVSGMKVTDFIKGFGGEDEVVTTEDYQNMKPMIIGSFFVMLFVSRIFTMLFYIVAIVAINKLLKSPITAGRTFMQTCGIYCFASIPAMCFATVYSSLPVDFLDFSSAYLLALLFYIFFVSGRYLLPEDFLIKQSKPTED